MTRDDDRFASLPEASRLNLVEAQLAALYEVGSVLSRSLNLRETLRETLREVLTLLSDRNRLSYGMVCLVDRRPENCWSAPCTTRSRSPSRRCVTAPARGS